MVMIPFTTYAPDLAAFNAPGMPKLYNCAPAQGNQPGTVTLLPLKAASLFSSTAMASQPIGAAVGQDKFDTAKVYGGCATKLYRLDAATRQWIDATRTAGNYTTAEGGRWKTVQFGNLQIFSNYYDEIQYIDMNVDQRFSNLTTLVKARHINTHKGFVIVGDTYDAIDGAMRNRVRWSALENPFDFNFSQATQSDFQDINGMGKVQGVVVDDNCYVLMQRGIVQMTYVGGQLIFQFTDRVTGKGCTAPESVITVENKHFFLSDDGFYMLQGGQLTPIGNGRINQWFLDNADLARLNQVTAVVDVRQTLVYWNFTSKTSPDGMPDTQLIYNYAIGEWSTAQATCSFVWNSMSLPWTLDLLDQFVSIDAVPASFDDPLWSGGQNQLWGMDKTGKIYSFSGPTLELSLETPEYQLSSQMEGGKDLAIISAVRPLFEGDGTARIRVGTKAKMNDNLSWSPLTECNAITGFAYTRSHSRYQRFRLTIAGEWKKAVGIEIQAQPAGKR